MEVEEVINLVASTELLGSEQSARGNRICLHADRYYELR
jgi:hypothetical protein